MANEKDETVSPAREDRFSKEFQGSWEIPPARVWRHEWVPKNFPMDGSQITRRYYSPEEVDTMLTAYASHVSSQAIGAAAKEAAEKIDGITHLLCEVSPEQGKARIEAIILRAIEKARTK